MPTLARDEVELINPDVQTRAGYDLLRAYARTSWEDRQGRWHVIVTASRIPEIEAVERRHRQAEVRP